jgi:hypothetical protein
MLNQIADGAKVVLIIKEQMNLKEMKMYELY